MKHDVLEMLMRQLKEKNIYHNDGKGTLYRYDHKRGIWMALDGLSGRQYLSTDIMSSLRIGERDELFRELREDTHFTESDLAEESATPLVVASNGVVNLENGDLQQHAQKPFLRKALDFTYNKKMTELPADNAWSSFITTSLGIKDVNHDDTGKSQLFLEAIAYALSGLPNAKKMVILLGPPNCGKSVVLEFLHRVVDENSWMPMTFADMSQRFRGSLMEKAQLLICDEMPVKPLKNLDLLKKVISGNPIIIEQKGANPKKFKPQAKIVVAANQFPTLGEPDVGGAFAERLLPILFVKRDNETDPYLSDKLWEDRDDFLSVAMNKMPDFIKRNLSFNLDSNSEQILTEFKSSSFSLENFIRECCVKEASSRLCLAEFYNRYIKFCNDNFSAAITKKETKVALTQLGYSTERQRIAGYDNARACILGLNFKHEQPQDSSAEDIPTKQTVIIKRKDV